MARTRGRTRLIAEYVAVRFGYSVFAYLPFSWSMCLGRAVGALWRRVDRRHRERVAEQVRSRLALPPERVEAFVRKNFEHYGLALAEFCRLGRFSRGDLEKRIDVNGYDAFIGEVLAKGRGAVFIIAHLGNWEWLCSSIPLFGFTGGAIARPLDNPLVNEFVRTIRERQGLRILDKQGAIRGALKCLKNGEALGALIDQDAGYLGLMSPFLGETASTITVPMELALRVGSPMVTVAMIREEGRPGHFKVVYDPVVEYPDPDAEPGTEIKRLVDLFNDKLGKLVMVAPEQWFWAHRRWKTRDGRTAVNGMDNA